MIYICVFRELIPMDCGTLVWSSPRLGGSLERREDTPTIQILEGVLVDTWWGSPEHQEIELRMAEDWGLVD